jgi:glycosyltransferase involved in cell wall biosynthesis
MKISVVIITFNEEKNIGRCLNSVKDIADEIVVVDSFSTDQTEAICREFGVRFIQKEFLGYAEQKRFADLQANYDWIFSIDADEALSEKLKNEILYIKNTQATADAYQMPRLTNYIGKWIRHTDWYPDKKIRFYNRKKARWQGTNLHEHIATDTNAKVASLKGDLLHYSYYSIHQHIAQLNKFTEIGAEEAFKKGKKAPLYKIFINPIWKFVYSYFLRLGFLDGYKGFLVCAISAFATFAKYIKLRELHKKKAIF